MNTTGIRINANGNIRPIRRRRKEQPKALVHFLEDTVFSFGSGWGPIPAPLYFIKSSRFLYLNVASHFADFI